MEKRMNPPVEPSRTTLNLFFGTLTLLFFVLLIQPMGDPDTWIHLRNGKHILEHGISGYPEPFSFTAARENWDPVEWLFQVIMYLHYSLGGLGLVIIAKSLLLAFNLCWLSIIAWRRDRNLIVLLITLVFTALAFNTKYYPERPQLITQLFLGILLWALIKYVQQPPKKNDVWPKNFWWGPVFFALWANFHPGVIIGFGVIGLFIISEIILWLRPEAEISREAGIRIRGLSFLLLICAIGASFNSIGPKIFLYPFGMYKWPILRQGIIEWQSPQYRLVPIFFWYLGISWLVVILNIKKCRLWEGIMLGAFSYLALSSYRHIFLFLVVNFFIFPRHLAQILSHYRWKKLKTRWPALFNIAGNMRLLSAAFMVMAILAITTGFSFRFGVLDNMVCEGGVKFLTARKVPGPLFNLLKWGGYVSFMTEGKYRVFIDGRGYIHRRVMPDYFQIVHGSDAALAKLDQYRINAVLLAPLKNKRLILKMLLSGRWDLIFWDDFCQLYIRRKPENQAWLEQFAYQHFNPMNETHLMPSHQAGAVKELQRTLEQDPENYHALYFLGDIYLTQGEYEKAEPMLAKSVRFCDDMMHTLFALGKTRFFLRKYREALPPLWKAFRQADRKYKAESLFFLSACYFELGERHLGEKYGRKAMKLRPEDKRYQIGLDRYLRRSY